MSNQADDNGTDVEIYPRHGGPTVYAVSRTAAPARLLDLLDAHGFTRHGEAIYTWHQLPEDLSATEVSRTCQNAHQALVAAGFNAQLDDRLLPRHATPRRAVQASQEATPAEHFDHSRPVPSLEVHGRLGSREARFTLHPTISHHAPDGRPTPGILVDVSTRFRIPLVFTVTFWRSEDGSWEALPVRCRQDGYLASVRAVMPHVAAAAAKIIEGRNDELRPLLRVAQEREAAHALAAVHRARQEVAEASCRARHEEALFEQVGISEARATTVMAALQSHRR
ncbi:hypothetical protein [Streptomyces sp. NPDC055912]|uniref:hypothetical protein n=1 Tax=Streptomyces sp. NPDC055912 TaxID=3345660 RepID=UPI0035E1B28E